jgi:Flp pilus assembly protein TadG
MVEYALVLPVFLWLAVGVVDFGRAIWEYNTVAFLARDGAHFASIPTHSTSDINSHVRGLCMTMLSQTCYTPPLPSPLPASTAAISVTRGTCGSTSSPAVVTVTYQFQAASLMIADLWGGGALRLQASSTMYVEAAPAGGCAS